MNDQQHFKENTDGTSVPVRELNVTFSYSHGPRIEHWILRVVNQADSAVTVAHRPTSDTTQNGRSVHQLCGYKFGLTWSTSY